MAESKASLDTVITDINLRETVYLDAELAAALRAATWALIAAQVMHTTVWIYQNTLPSTWPA